MENEIKKIELTEKEERNLFCAAWHLTNLWEDAKDKKVANFATPCETCKYQEECWENDKCYAYKNFETLTKLTGVKISPLIGFRSMLKKGSQSFLKEDSV